MDTTSYFLDPQDRTPKKPQKQGSGQGPCPKRGVPGGGRVRLSPRDREGNPYSIFPSSPKLPKTRSEGDPKTGVLLPGPTGGSIF